MRTTSNLLPHQCNSLGQLNRSRTTDSSAGPCDRSDSALMQDGMDIIHRCDGVNTQRRVRGLATAAGTRGVAVRVIEKAGEGKRESNGEQDDSRTCFIEPELYLVTTCPGLIFLRPMTFIDYLSRRQRSSPATVHGLSLRLRRPREDKDSTQTSDLRRRMAKSLQPTLAEMRRRPSL